MIIVTETVVTEHPVMSHFHTGSPGVLAPLPHPAIEIGLVGIFEAVTDFHAMLEMITAVVATIQPADGIGFFHLQYTEKRLASCFQVVAWP